MISTWPMIDRKDLFYGDFIVRNETGFTLLEVMISVAILAITLTVIYGSQSQSLSLAAEAKFNIRAAFLLQQKVAELESGNSDLQSDEGEFGEDYPGFRWRVDVDDAVFDTREFGVDPEQPLKRVMVEVFWENSPFTHAVDYYLQERDGE